MKYIILLSVFFIGISVYAQQPYKYVIIPTHFSEFGNDLNPYGLSSAIQTELDKHSIEGVFATDNMPPDYCEALTVNLVKTSGLLKNKLKVELKDCMNKLVWSNEGTGRSKDFRAGFGEALTDALKDLDRLPANTTMATLAHTTTTTPKIVAVAGEPVSVKTQAENAAPTSQITGAVVSVDKQTTALPDGAEADGYKPVNPYYNGTYLIDVVEAGENKKELLILNGDALGYKNRQKIATLSPSGLDDVFSISWTKPGGTSVSGVARLNDAKLEISLNENGNKEVIMLQKL
ncbi:MAG: hypothetical protein ACK5M7_16160 [Draconibacterium sp.]